MKRITLLIIFGALLCTLNELYAQSWNIGGNPNADIPMAGGRFGSNGNRLIIFETNNTERARMMNTSGFWGFNTTAPNARVHINSLAGEDAFRVQVNGLSKLFVDDGGGVSIGSASTPPANGLFVSGSAGIGTTAPAVKLHVAGGSDASLGGGGFIVTGSTTGANISIDDNEIMARSNGAASDLFLNHNGGNLLINGTNATGNVGIGTTAPGNRLHIRQAIANRAIELQHESTSDFWTIGIGTNTHNFRFEFNSVGKADISSVDGSYNAFGAPLSQLQNIESMPKVLDKVMQLKPSLYYFQDSRAFAKNKSIGFIAQDVEKVLPELIRNDDGGSKWMNYSALTVISIKAIQELRPVVDEQKAKIATLEDRIAKLEAALNSLSSSNSVSNAELKGISLEQNQPNPFNQTTVIRYKIPVGANAQINIYNAAGVIIKTMRATDSGQAQINAGELKAGTYTYTLVVDGKQLASKRMIMLR